VTLNRRPAAAPAAASACAGRAVAPAMPAARGPTPTFHPRRASQDGLASTAGMVRVAER